MQKWDAQPLPAGSDVSLGCWRLSVVVLKTEHQRNTKSENLFAGVSAIQEDSRLSVLQEDRWMGTAAKPA